jgi:hypothetical protein
MPNKGIVARELGAAAVADMSRKRDSRGNVSGTFVFRTIGSREEFRLDNVPMSGPFVPSQLVDPCKRFLRHGKRVRTIQKTSRQRLTHPAMLADVLLLCLEMSCLVNPGISRPTKEQSAVATGVFFGFFHWF